MLGDFLFRIRALVRRSRLTNEMDEELRVHVQNRADDLERSGLIRAEAERRARIEFGGYQRFREECRDALGASFLDALFQDLRFGLRVLRKSPGFTAIAVLTLGLGIGANTAIFSVVNAALLRALPVRDPQNLLLLQWTARSDLKHLSYSSYGDCERVHGDARPMGCSFSEPMYKQIRGGTNVFSSMAAFAGGDRVDLSGNGTPTTVDSSVYVSGEYFDILGVRPLIGRLIGPEDDAANAPPVVVLSYAFWKSNFAGSPSVVGQSILLNRVPFTIVGVAEPRFDALSPGNSVQLWLPLSTAPSIELPWDNRDADPNSWWLVVVARLKPGVERLQAQAAVSIFFRNEVLHAAKPVSKPEDEPALLLTPAQKGLTGNTTDISAPLYVLMLAVGVVLLIACANVAGLMLSRAAARQKEIAVRFALGARRGRVLRQLLTESLILSFAGGILGALLAEWASVAIAATVAANQDGPPFQAGLDARVLAFTAAISILTGILFGFAPALHGIRVDLTPALKDGAATAGPRKRRFSAANALVVAQVALTIVVLVAAGLLVRTLQNLKSVDPGFDTRNILTFRVDPTLIGYKRADVDNFYSNLQMRLAALPGVTSVSHSWRPLLGSGLWTTGFHLQGTPEGEQAECDFMPVGPAFFSTMRIAFRQGRDFTPQDFAQSQRVEEILATEREKVAAAIKAPSGSSPQDKVKAADLPPVPAIVNETFIRKYFPKGNPIGIRFGAHDADQQEPTASPGWEIVGVVGNAKYNRLRREIQPTLYVPAGGRSSTVTLRAVGNPENLVPQIRAVVAGLDSNLPVFQIRTETQQIDRQLFQERLIARLSSFFGLLALVLACIGLYGLLSYEVSRHTREIGIRMALGARAGNVFRQVVGQGLALATLGAALGIGVALLITRFLESLLYNVHAADPLTFVGVVLLLVAVAVLACYLPARRATRVDPLVALRYE